MGRFSSLWLVSWLVPILPLSSWHAELDKYHISLSQSHSKENIEALCSPRPLELELPQCLMLLLFMLPLPLLMPQLYMLPVPLLTLLLLDMLLLTLLRCLLTVTTMLLLMITLEQLSTRLRPMMALVLLRDPTLSTFLMDVSSM